MHLPHHPDASAPVIVEIDPEQTLVRMGRLLERLGRPQDRLPPVVHVAGTNGKGSTIAFLRAMLEAAGHKVHVYTSPHLVRFNERIRLTGRLIGDQELLALMERCQAINGDDPLGGFELTTAAALTAFAEQPADVVLLETGLGGRTDATNVVDRPAVTAITRISFDHMQHLGGTLAQIAAEKAGIFKPGCPVVLGPQADAAVLAVLRDRAAAVGAPLAPDWQISRRAGGFRFDSAARGVDLPPPVLPGLHQLANAGTAIACLAHLPLAAPDEAVARGLLTADWPARLQHLTQGRLPRYLPPTWQLWLDGGHNDSAGQVLAAQAAAWRQADGKPLDLVVGMVADKRPVDFLRPLAPFVRRLMAVTIPGTDERTLDANAIAAAATAAGVAQVEVAGGIADALARLGAQTFPPARALICGSLYLAGAALSENGAC